MQYKCISITVCAKIAIFGRYLGETRRHCTGQNISSRTHEWHSSLVPEELYLVLSVGRNSCCQPFLA